MCFSAEDQIDFFALIAMAAVCQVTLCVVIQEGRTLPVGKTLFECLGQIDTLNIVTMIMDGCQHKLHGEMRTKQFVR